jgi:enamine deaminase RidA (YjgF/YER057c/UK114 family)
MGAQSIRALIWTTYLYEDLQRALKEAGGSLRDVVKLTFYLKDLRDLRAVERIHRRYFPGGNESQPAVTVLTIDELGMHDFQLEIEMIADLDSASRGASRFVRLSSPKPLSARHPHAARAGGLLWVGGLFGMGADADGAKTRRVLGKAGLAVWNISAPGVAATLSAYDGLSRVLAGGKLGLEDVVKLTIYATDPADVVAIEAATRATFPRNPPAITLVGVHSLPVPGARVEVEAIAG